MHFVKVLLVLSVVVQVYYLYEFIYSIPMKKEILKIKNDNAITNMLLRGFTSEKSNSFMKINNGSFHETHKQTHLPLPLPKQKMHDNNTALIYKFATTLGAVYPS